MFPRQLASMLSIILDGRVLAADGPHSDAPGKQRIGLTSEAHGTHLKQFGMLRHIDPPSGDSLPQLVVGTKIAALGRANSKVVNAGRARQVGPSRMARFH